MSVAVVVEDSTAGCSTGAVEQREGVVLYEP